jgi:hypothetical protein
MRDAPEAVRQLCFDLETMSMALRQFEQYRQNDVSGSELLSRCIVACDQAVAKVKNAVDKIDRLLSRARFAGRVYMGFKEPEVRKLMEEVEHAKSSILLAYTSYCQFVSPRLLDPSLLMSFQGHGVCGKAQDMLPHSHFKLSVWTCYRPALSLVIWLYLDTSRHLLRNKSLRPRTLPNSLTRTAILLAKDRGPKEPGTARNTSSVWHCHSAWSSAFGNSVSTSATMPGHSSSNLSTYARLIRTPLTLCGQETSVPFVSL